MKRQSGFTLIELVVVIVILGILAVTAAPRFLDISSDAKKSTLKGLKGAVNSAFTLVHSKAVLEGKERKKTATLSNGIKIRYGYPTHKDGGLDKAVSGLSSDFSKKDVIDGYILYSFKGNVNWEPDGTGCYLLITYADSYAPTPPTVELSEEGC